MKNFLGVGALIVLAVVCFGQVKIALTADSVSTAYVSNRKTVDDSSSAKSNGAYKDDIVQDNQTRTAYKDSTLPVEKRVDNLIQRMTIEEKVGQLRSIFEWYSVEEVKTDSLFQSILSEHQGFVQPQQNDIKVNIRNRNATQKYLKEQTRLSIPAIFTDEALHGLAKNQATSFPQAIALGSTWNPELIEEVFSAIALETRKRGAQLVLSPVLDVARDPRWGRFEECYGEDPYHVGKMGAAAVRGLQGSADGKVKPEHVAATLKHFVGHGTKEGGRNKAPANYSETIIRNIHIEPFRIAINESKPVAIMPSYNEVNSLPLHANEYMLQNVLRGQLNFNGMYVADYWAIGELSSMHRLASDTKEAARMAFNAGVEYDFPDGGHFRFLPELLKEEKVSIEDIDRAVKKVLRLKFKLGLFEDPFVDKEQAISISKRESHRQLALKAAHQSIILLKNESEILPLDKTTNKKIAMIGPNANDTRLGEYSGTPYYKVTVLEGMDDKFKNAEVVYSEGVKIVENLLPNSRKSWFQDSIAWPDDKTNAARIEEARQVAENSDVIIMVIGENEMISRESWSYNHLGDNSTLKLQSEQMKLFDAMKATGKPVIVCLNHGRPLNIKRIAEEADAVLDLWYTGQEMGNAVADIISGDVNPSGKLTATYPNSVGQIPVHYNRKPSSARDYLSEEFGSIYPFGFGLSYTTFQYDDIHLSDSVMLTDDRVKVHVKVKNTGTRAGAEIVQLYLRNEFASITRPIKELKGFKRVKLNPGETKDVDFLIDKETLSFWNFEGEHVAEPGNFTIMIGSSSADIKESMTLTLKK